MSTTVRLDPRTESLIRRLARTRGQSKSEVIRSAIRRLAEAEGPTGPGRTVGERIAHLIGIGDSGGARLSERTGEKVRALLRARRASRAAH
ncbi:MAG: ribbon-helix-helix protein, CopG family [Candidatus Rokuibacteriota bacterium]